MMVGVLKETFPGERRVALIPTIAAPLIKRGINVRVEAGAGQLAGYPDSEYAARGVEVVADRRALIAASDVLLQVNGYSMNKEHGRSDLAHFRRGQVLIAMMDPLSSGPLLAELAETGVTAFALELIPRITRAQSMDVLSSMATLAGYKAVLMAADALPRIFPMLTTAAGTVSAARVFVVGAGVAGLQACATARRLGAVVQAYDVRPAVKEQVQSVGAKFVELPLETGASEDKGGYAKGQDESFLRRQRELMTKVVAGSDVVITTALVPGRPAPKLITKEMVSGMAPGSVIIDLAAERGGNCESTQPGEVVSAGDVRIFGPLNLPSTVPFHASQMFAKNVTTFLNALLDKQGNLLINKEDEVIRETLVTEEGKIVHERVRAAAAA